MFSNAHKCFFLTVLTLGCVFGAVVSTNAANIEAFIISAAILVVAAIENNRKD
jgi:hypothetical protein